MRGSPEGEAFLGVSVHLLVFIVVSCVVLEHLGTWVRHVFVFLCLTSAQYCVLPSTSAPIHVCLHHRDDANVRSSKRQITWMQAGGAGRLGTKGGRKGWCEARWKGEKEQMLSKLDV